MDSSGASNKELFQRAGPNYIVFQQGDASLVTHFAIPWKAHTVVPTSLAQRSFAAEQRRTPELKVTKIRSIIALSTNMVIVLEAPQQLNKASKFAVFFSLENVLKYHHYLVMGILAFFCVNSKYVFF